MSDHPSGTAGSTSPGAGSTSPRAGSWKLTREALSGLLAALDPDPARAGDAYERIRFKLIKFFAWRRILDADRLADETINRVARRLQQGEVIQAEDPYRYFAGVARMIYREVLRQERRRREKLEEHRWLAGQGADFSDEEKELSLRCLESALERLPADRRRLILRYYRGDGGRKIENRKQLAAELGVAINALRIRAHRIRLQLEAMVKDCLRSVTEDESEV